MSTNKPGGVRSHAWSVGIPVPAGDGRIKLKYPADENLTPKHRLVEEFWVTLQEARDGRGCYLNSQPWSVIDELIEEYGARIWCHGERSHLLAVGARGEYTRALYWPEDKMDIKNHFRKMHACGDRKSSGRASTPRKRKRESHGEILDVIWPRNPFGCPPIQTSYPENGDHVYAVSHLHVEEPDDINLYRTHLWMKDSKNTCTAQVILGTLDTIPTFFDAIKEAFIDQNADEADLVNSKGEVVAITVMFWNLGPTEVKDVKSPFTVDVTMPSERLRSLRLHLGLGFRKYRQENEQLLCIGTVLFENDLREEMSAK